VVNVPAVGVVVAVVGDREAPLVDNDDVPNVCEPVLVGADPVLPRPNFAAKASKESDIAVLRPNLAAKASNSGSDAIDVPTVGVDARAPGAVDELLETVAVPTVGNEALAPLEALGVVGPMKPLGLPGSKVDDCA